MRRAVVLMFVFLALAGCGVKRYVPPSDLTALPTSELWTRAEDLVNIKEFGGARLLLNEIVRRSPNQYVADSRFLVGKLYFEERNYDEAIDRLSEYLESHPGHSKAEEAHWLIALSYERQMLPYDRDQTSTKRMLGWLDLLLTRFPETKHWQGAADKIKNGKTRLAQSSFSIAEFYFKEGENIRKDPLQCAISRIAGKNCKDDAKRFYGAARSRFREILERYNGLGYDEQTESYIKKIDKIRSRP